LWACRTIYTSRTRSSIYALKARCTINSCTGRTGRTINSSYTGSTGRTINSSYTSRTGRTINSSYAGRTGRTINSSYTRRTINAGSTCGTADIAGHVCTVGRAIVNKYLITDNSVPFVYCASRRVVGRRSVKFNISIL
jgi:hypothetical protein